MRPRPEQSVLIRHTPFQYWAPEGSCRYERRIPQEKTQPVESLCLDITDYLNDPPRPEKRRPVPPPLPKSAPWSVE